uniref:UNC93-like protein MFSD11 n=1 Tax=Steinernema glaseri TaxID=37863 RepID=A0A1I7YHU7_9BILA
MGASNNELRNVVQTGVAFLFLLFAFNSQAVIEPSLIKAASNRGGISSNAGYVSLGIVYLMFSLGNFIAVPIIERTGAKLAMTIGGICYVVFIVGFLFLNEIYLYFSSAVVGFGAAILWTGQGNYLTMISTGENARRNSGILWAIFQSSIWMGGIFLLGIFTFVDSGQEIAQSSIRPLYSVFTAANIIGVVILAFLPKPVQDIPRAKTSTTKTLLSTFELLRTKKMLYLVLAFGFTGLETSMWQGVFPTSVAFTTRLGSNTNALIAIGAINIGLGQLIGGFVFGILGQHIARFGRHNIVLTGMVLHLFTFALIFVNFPSGVSLAASDEKGLIEPSVVLAMLCGFLLGLCDSIWNTQLYAFLVDNFKTQSSQAFALFRACQAFCAFAAFFYGTVTTLHGHLIILSITAVLGAIGFYSSEMIVAQERKSSSALEELDPETKSLSIAA